MMARASKGPWRTEGCCRLAGYERTSGGDASSEGDSRLNDPQRPVARSPTPDQSFLIRKRRAFPALSPILRGSGEYLKTGV